MAKAKRLIGEYRNCPQCGKHYYRSRSYVELRRMIVCSRTCAARYFRDKGTWEPCENCGKQFYRRASQASQGFGKCCSRECHFKQRSNKLERTCLQCGTDFTVPNYQVTVKKGGKFCSQDCHYTFRRRLRKRGEKNMFTNWQKREWKETKCAKCGSSEKLELDHIIPRFAGGTTDRSNAQTLCRTCNRKKFWESDLPYYENLFTQQEES
jgi:5-methylcytosine-specific restriction endonuclease McrA